MNSYKDKYFLEMALEEAEQALKENTYPIGAVIVDENYNLIAKGRNRVHTKQDATGHAEIDAIRNAGQTIRLIIFSIASYYLRGFNFTTTGLFRQPFFHYLSSTKGEFSSIKNCFEVFVKPIIRRYN